MRGGADIDLGRAERAVADLLDALGQDTSDEHTRASHRLRSRAEFFALTGAR